MNALPSAIAEVVGFFYLCEGVREVRSFYELYVTKTTMFGLFKKTSWKIEGKALHFFRQIFAQLPAEYTFLRAGLDNGLYKRFYANRAMNGLYSIGFEPSQSDKSMTKGVRFELENIIIIQDEQSYPLTITVYDGLWVNFEMQKSILDFNNFQVDLSSIRKNINKFAADKKIEKLVNGLICEQLDLVTLDELDIDGKTYYSIKDFEDGNYIAIDEKGQVFGLIHDPYKIELLNKSVRQFVDDVNSGNFNFVKYLHVV